MLNKLRKELLFEIFDLLPIEDLLNITTVCKTFNIFVNNTKLVEKFTLHFDQNITNRDWIGSRKYTKLSIENDSGAFGILKCIGDDIKHVEMSTKSIDVKTISRLLSLCPNMTYLKFVDVKTHSCLDLMVKSEMPRHKNLEVWIENTTPNILEIFKFVQIRKLTLLAPTSMSDFGVCWNVDDCRMIFNNFMKSQKELTVLDMRNFKSNASIFSDKNLNFVSFKLKELKLQNFAVNNVNFYQFLNNHLDTLELASIDTKCATDDLMMFLSNCENLHTLNFTGNLKIHKKVFKSVQKLTAEFNFTPLNWTEMFPNLTDLKISSGCENAFTNFEKLTKLERLEIHSSHFFDNHFLNIPNVKKLIFRDISYQWPSFFKEYPEKLEEFHIQSMNVQFLIEFLAFNRLNLQLLVIKNPFRFSFYKSCLHFDPQRIKSLKIYEFETSNVKYADEEFDDEYF
ncbi:hypothetical protein PVAND_017100 [Polypedilum vanderplanki]|uniref:F-box domain-containing protein n=1 Tax=Polypedilum vanderplanki TaxID=319348 RepID=A0A9J6BI20_POLVA|nr:hypothetical protein PVAND_017100 [Polypedilum vanderplanki]